MVSTLTKNQHQRCDGIKEKKLIEEEITNHHRHQGILVEIPTQMRMTMIITTKMEAMAGAREADVWKTKLKDPHFQEMLLPVLGQC